MKNTDKYRGKRKSKGIWIFGSFVIGIFILAICFSVAMSVAANKAVTPLAFLKAQELAHKDAKKEVYLGKVLTINYPVNSAKVAKKYDRLVQELCDVLKTPERRSYRLVIIGYTDNTGPRWLNKKLSLRRAQELRRLLVEKYYLDPTRIIVNGYGPENPVASNATPSGRALNRRSEIHVFGDVTEAVKSLLPPPPPKVAQKKPPKPKVIVKKKKEEAVPLFKPKKPVVAPKPAPKVVTKPVTRPRRGTPPIVGTLPNALKGLTIRDYFIPSAEKRAGTIRALLGHVVVVHRGTNEAYFARPGDIVYENDAVYTLDKSRCRINFFDDDLVSMAANTEFAVDQYEDKREEKKKTSFFSMLKGKAMFFALRLFRYKQMAFRVKTPTAVVGVRGTKFGVYVRLMEEKTATSGYPLVASSDPSEAFVVASAGGGSGQYCTEAFCADGLLAVDGKEVPAGYKYDCETGEVAPYDPEYLRKFEEDTGVGTSKEAGAGEEEEGFEPPLGLDQDQLANGQEEQGNSTNDQNVPTTSGQYLGYFAAFLTRDQNGDLAFRDAYISSTAQDFASSSITAQSFVSSGGSMSLTPGFMDNTTSYLSGFSSTNGGTLDPGSLGTSYPLNVTQVGSNSYMEWGYWTMTTPVDTGADTHYVDNPAWYIFGEVTTDTIVSGLQGNVSYSGSAYGTYYNTLSGGVRLDGSFSCQVDFTSGSVSSFAVSVTDTSDTYGVGISGAGGSISGGQFSVTGGTWSIWDYNRELSDTATGSNQSAHGTFYGPSAERVGGTWGLRGDSTGVTAVGVFEGSKQ